MPLNVGWTLPVTLMGIMSVRHGPAVRLFRCVAGCSCRGSRVVQLVTQRSDLAADAVAWRALCKDPVFLGLRRTRDGAIVYCDNYHKPYTVTHNSTSTQSWTWTCGSCSWGSIAHACVVLATSADPLSTSQRLSLTPESATHTASAQANGCPRTVRTHVAITMPRGDSAHPAVRL